MNKKLVRVITSTVSCGISGFESPAKEYLDLPLKLDDLLINQANSTFLAKVTDHSMSGYGIFNGDLLLIDRAAAKSDMDIVAATLNGEFVCKSIDRKKSTLVSKSIETDCINESIYHLKNDDDFCEEGLVISSIRLHRTPMELVKCMP